MGAIDVPVPLVRNRGRYMTRVRGAATELTVEYFPLVPGAL